MEVRFERSGGIAGTIQRYSVSLDSLGEEERRKLTELIANSRFFDLPAVLEHNSGADAFQYRISVSSDQGTHEVQVDQGAVPAELHPLIAWLQAAARKR
jgi:hypothetical protein